MRRAVTSSHDYRIMHCGGPLTLEKVAKLAHLKRIYKPDYTICSQGLIGNGYDYIDKGKIMVAALNVAGVDAIGINNIDKAWGTSVLSQRIKQFDGKVLSTTDIQGVSGTYKYVRDIIGSQDKNTTCLTSLSSMQPENISELRKIIEQFRVSPTIALSQMEFSDTHKVGSQLLNDLKGTIPIILSSGDDAEEKLETGIRIVQSEECVSLIDVWHATNSVHMVTRRKDYNEMDPDLEHLFKAHTRMINGLLDTVIDSNIDRSSKGFLQSFMIDVATRLRVASKADVVLIHRGMFLESDDVRKTILTPRHIQDEIMPYPSPMIMIEVSVKKINEILTWKARREVHALEMGNAGTYDELVTDDHWQPRFPLESKLTKKVISDQNKTLKVLVPYNLTQGGMFRPLTETQPSPDGIKLNAMILLMSGIYEQQIRKTRENRNKDVIASTA